MSQPILFFADISNSGMLPAPAWSNLNINIPINQLVDEIVAGADVTCSLGGPVDIPTQNTLVTLAVIIDWNAIQGSGSSPLGTLQVNLNSFLFGFISELSTFDFPAPQGINIVTKSILLDTLMANYATTPTIFFGNLDNIQISLSVSQTVPGTFGGTVEFRGYSFTVPNAFITTLILQEDPLLPADESAIDGGIDANGVPIEVLSVDSSGLYVLTPGKTDDTLYTRNVAQATDDVAIPDPTIKTALLGD